MQELTPTANMRRSWWNLDMAGSPSWTRYMQECNARNSHDTHSSSRNRRRRTVAPSRKLYTMV